MKRRHVEGDAASDLKKRKATDSEITKMTVAPISQFSTSPCPVYKQPVELGCFSLDIDRAFHSDRRGLRTYCAPDVRLRLHLSAGYDGYVEKEGTEYLDHILTWITYNLSSLQRHSILLSNERLPFDFITWRGQFTKIMCTPYERRDPWRIGLSLWNGTIYMTELETEHSRQQKLTQTERQKLMCYWGRKFEDYCTEERSSLEVRNPVNNMEAFCSVVSTSLDDYRILMAGEVDCMRKECDKKPPENYIELKTSRKIEGHRQGSSFRRFKLLRWWCQSYLLGVPEIIAGFRDDDGILQHLTTYRTLELPNLVKSERNVWSGSLCLTFTKKLLSWIQTVVTKENVVYVMDWESPFTHVTMEETQEDKFVFLRQWYIKNLESNDQVGQRQAHQ
ncbi:decapping and exoribonuclease protein-like isoform X2 [Corticium candelabrum]|uniref:decapping and exoribonuclease protein-like isoform X2 n=1 Tax=Corticium candelabrum TaxID=121492 RepID=UPI002E318909|nr:decapping and exoribonuclease protein-like isoform X2 [Corticium candelabrum]